jgi:ADP-ribose pyrophosphatase
MKIPPEAKKVFAGSQFDVYQWAQKMFDGSEEVFEVVKRPDSVQVIAVSGDNLVISDEEQPGRGRFYSLFGGVKEKGEDPLEAAKRELREESGLASTDWELYRVFCSPGRVLWDVHIFIARDCRKAGDQALDAGEKITPQSVSVDTFFAMLGKTDFRGRELLFDLAVEYQTAAGKERIRQYLFGK